MTLSQKAQEIHTQLSGTPRMGDIKKMAKEIKKDHDLAMELWSTGEYFPRMLAVLIMDKNLLTQEVIEGLASDLASNEFDQRNRISEWLMANQLMKSSKTKALLTTWEDHPSPTLRRLFWYHQARLRWTGQTPPDNTGELVASLEKNFATDDPEVQWAMNFTAGQIGIHDPAYRSQMIALGEQVGLYKGDPVPRGCTPNYLPEFIKIESAKREK